MIDRSAADGTDESGRHPSGASPAARSGNRDARVWVRPLLLVVLVVLSGCANPLAPAGTPTESPVPTAPPSPAADGTTDTATREPAGGSPTATIEGNSTLTTPAEEEYPPGVSGDGIDNATTLLRAHAEELRGTGFVAVGNGTGTVERSGIFVDVESVQWNMVTPDASTFEVQRELDASLFQREIHVWSNGSVEHVRRQQGGATNYTTRPSRSLERLAGLGLLSPYLRGGEFATRGVGNGSVATRSVGNESDERLLVLVATGVDNETELGRALPDETEEITGFQATVKIDPAGRIHSLEASIEYVIAGRDATHTLDYELTRIGGVRIDPPDWLGAEAAAANESG